MKKVIIQGVVGAAAVLSIAIELMADKGYSFFVQMNQMLIFQWGKEIFTTLYFFMLVLDFLYREKESSAVSPKMPRPLWWLSASVAVFLLLSLFIL